jgi:hypothetical protein
MEVTGEAWLVGNATHVHDRGDHGMGEHG